MKENERLVCKFCGHVSTFGQGSIKCHLRKHHNMNLKYYYDKFYKTYIEGNCKICNAETQFLDYHNKLKYSKYCSQTCVAKDTKLIKELNDNLDWKTEQAVAASKRLTKTLKREYSMKNRKQLQKQLMLKRHADPVVHEQLIRGILAFNQTAERSELSSKIASKNARFRYNGKITLYKNIKFKSSWEAKFAKQLDELKINWEYEPKVFKLETGKRYIPDFYLTKENCFVEIKPAHFVDKTVLDKLLFVKNKGFNTMLLTNNNWNGCINELGKVRG